MNNAFESAYALLNRAYGHTESLQTWVSIYRSSNIGEFVVEDDPKTGYKVHKWRLVQRPPLIMAAVVFDAINCMRSALDHAVFDASVLLGGKPKPKFTKFPFGPDEDAAKADLPRKDSEVPEVIRPHLLSFKPYKPENGGNDLLWGFNELRNQKIHRFLEALVTSGAATSVGGTFVTGFTEFRSDWDDAKSEYTYMVTDEGLHGQPQINITIDIGFSEGTPFPRQPIVALANRFFYECLRIVQSVEAESHRLARHARAAQSGK